MPTRRQRKVSELIQKEICQILQKEIGDPRLNLVTVTSVEISPNLRQAHVYVTTMGGEEKREAALEGLQHATGFFRRELGARLYLRYVPEITFHLDDSYERGQRVEQLLEQIEAKREG
ncbi:MAG: 30S ribosome-binding factor RbfA [Anaerolineae bacterium]